ncbi:MAG: 5'-methylthioadenosine/adenosylhomocysteine nucleosidase [Clostridiales bacterium]|nr:5'-methylthioadenosine/adenosylhomocysteine nucleosidase [Clostridiales bacterium]
MIGIIGAMQVEIDCIRQALENPKSEVTGSISFVSGVLEGRQVVTAVCGIGKVNAAMCAQTMILRFSPECILNTGVAGSLSSSLSILDVAVGEKLVEHDMDTTPIGDPPGFINGINLVEIPADKSVCDKVCQSAAALGIKTVRGVIASGDQFIASAERKGKIVSTFGAIACEMEGASIAHVCCANKVPFSVVRAISDCADGSSHMDYPEFLSKASASAAELIKLFVKNY